MLIFMGCSTYVIYILKLHLIYSQNSQNDLVAKFNTLNTSNFFYITLKHSIGPHLLSHIKLWLAGQGPLTPDRLVLKVFCKSALVNPTVDGTCKDKILRAMIPKEIHEFCNERNQDHMLLRHSKSTSLVQCIIYFSNLPFNWHSIFLSDEIIITNPDKEFRK